MNILEMHPRKGLRRQLSCAWCGISFLPASLTGVLKIGPSAWDGLFGCYFPYFCRLCWFSVASIFMNREVHRRIADERAAPQGVCVAA